MQCNVKGQTWIRPSEKPWQQDQVSGTGDGKEFGRTLECAENHGLKKSHVAILSCRCLNCSRVAQHEIEMVCERPPHSLRSRLPLTRRETYACNVTALFSPSLRGRAAEGGRGVTHTPSGTGVAMTLLNLQD